MTPSTAQTRGGWAHLVPWFAANVLFAAGLYAHAFLYNFYLDALGFGPGVMGGAAAALTAGGLAALVPAGVLTDREGPAVTYGIAALACGAGLAAGAFVERSWAVYAAATLAGAGAAAWRVAMGPMLMRLAGPAVRSRAFSWNVALLVGSGAVWTAASGAVPAWIEQATGMAPLSAIRVALVGGAVLTACSVAGIAAVARAMVDDDGEATRPARPGGALRDLAIPAALVAGVALVAVWMTAGGLVIPFLNVYFLREHGMSVPRIGVLFAAAQAATALVLFASGEAAGRYGPQRVLVLWMFAFPPVLWLLAVADATALAVALYLVQGFVPPATNPLIDQVLLERAPAGRHGAVSSWRNAATEGSGLVGAALGGRLLEAATFGVLFAAAGAVAAAGALGLAAWLRAQPVAPASSSCARQVTRPRTMR